MQKGILIEVSRHCKQNFCLSWGAPIGFSGCSAAALLSSFLAPRFLKVVVVVRALV